MSTTPRPSVFHGHEPAVTEYHLSSFRIVFHGHEPAVTEYILSSFPSPWIWTYLASPFNNPWTWTRCHRAPSLVLPYSMDTRPSPRSNSDLRQLFWNLPCPISMNINSLLRTTPLLVPLFWNQSFRIRRKYNLHLHPQSNPMTPFCGTFPFCIFPWKLTLDWLVS